METIDEIESLLALLRDLESEGLKPILVGGMALVLMGSQRVTRDFDFLMSSKDSSFEKITEIFYKHGFELVSKLNEKMEVVRTIDNPKIASIRLRVDNPDSIYFFNHKTRLKIDLLFDFPFSAKEVADRAKKVKIRSQSVRLASPSDLIRMKEIAYKDRKSASDAQDLEFLRSLSVKKRK